MRISSVLPKQTLRHVGRAKFGWSHWPHQSYYTPPIPTSKKSGQTCLVYGRENSDKVQWVCGGSVKGGEREGVNSSRNKIIRFFR